MGKTIGKDNTPQYRKELFKSLCRHISNGYSMDSFPALSDKTIEQYLIDYPEEFDQNTLDQARRVGKSHWENIGHEQATGKCLGNSRSWYYNMSNRYGWSDRQQVKSDVQGSMQVQVISYASPKPSTQPSAQ